jgi:site-specific recombinase XerD
MKITKEVVRLYPRPSRDGRSFTYYLDYTDLQGKRHRPSLGHADAKKAEKQRKQIEKELLMGYVEPDSMRLSKFLDDWLERSANLVRKSTLKDYESIMRNFISVVGDRDFRQVGHSDGEYFLNWCIEHGNAAATVNKKVVTLKRIYNLAVSRRQIDENPFRFLKGPKASKKKVLVLSEHEIVNLIKGTSVVPDLYGLRWDIMILMAWVTGMRKGELLNLTWRDIDFENHVVEVTAKEDTAATWLWEIKDHDERTLPLTEELVDILTRLQVDVPEGCPYVFVPHARCQDVLQKRSEGKWDSIKTRENLIPHFSTQFKELRQKAGISKDVTFHDLRSTALSGWCNSGMSINDVKTLAGHSSITTTQEFYLAVTSDLVDRARKIKSSASESFLSHFVTHPKNGQNDAEEIACKSK